MAITASGAAQENHGIAATTVASVNPTTVGDLIIVGIGYASTTPVVSGLSHSGVTSWTLLKRATGGGMGVEVWMGKVTATGSATLTVAFSPSNSGVSTNIYVQKFTAGLGSGTPWALDGTLTGTTTGSAGTVTGPSLTPAASGELYFMAIRGNGTLTVGSTSGYTYAANGAATAGGIAYDPACATSAQAPTETAGSTWVTAAAVIAAATGAAAEPIVMVV